MPGKERRTATKAGRLPPAEKNLAGHLKFMEIGRRCQGKRVEREEKGKGKKGREEGRGKMERWKEGERRGKKGKGGWLAPWLLGSLAPGLLGPGAGGRLELLGACCVETAQFFFDHFREMQYPLFGAVERGRVG